MDSSNTMRLFEDANYGFIKNRKLAYIFSGTLILISIVGILVKGLNYGIDFRGGKEFVVEFQNDVTVRDIRNVLTDGLGAQPEVKKFGSDREMLIRTDVGGTINQLESKVANVLTTGIKDNPSKIVKTDVVGPRFAEDLKAAAADSILFSIIVIFLYVLIRFRKWQYSMGAVVALMHDVTITLGAFTLLNNIVPFNLTIDQTIIAAFLTIVGYSLNDTVVVYDRIRENKTIYKAMPFNDMVNKSINDTLSRTIITSGTTLFTVLVLFIFGGEVLKGLAFSLLVGIVIGTYSSIFVASAIVVDFDKTGAKAIKS